MYYVIAVYQGYSETIGEPFEDRREALAEVYDLMSVSRGTGVEYYVDDRSHNQMSLGFDMRTI